MHSDVRTSATCVRVSSLRSHSEAFGLTEKPLEVAEIRKVLEDAPGVTLVDDPQNYCLPYAIGECRQRRCVRWPHSQRPCR